MDMRNGTDDSVSPFRFEDAGDAADLLFLENQLVLRAVADDEQQRVHDDLGQQIGNAEIRQQQDADIVEQHDDGDQQVVADEGAVIGLGLEHHVAVDEVVEQGADDARARDGDQHDAGNQPAQQQEHDIVHQRGDQRGTHERAHLTEEQLVDAQTVLHGVEMGTGVVVDIDGFDEKVFFSTIMSPYSRPFITVVALNKQF